MKALMIFGFSFAVLFFSSCGGKAETASDSNVDVCRCMTSPGDSEYMTSNRDACRDAISREIGVENWEKVNMSREPEISARFDELAQRCMR